MSYPVFVLGLGVLGAAVGWCVAESIAAPAPRPEIARENAVPHEEAAAEPATAQPEAGPAAGARELGVGELLAREYPPVERRGSGSIHGTITDRRDRPQPGVVLIAEPVLPPPGDSLPERIRHHRELEARRRGAISDAEGRYVFAELPGDGLFAIRDPDGRIRSFAEFRPGDTADFQLNPLPANRPSVKLRVTLGGEVVPRARIETSNSNQIPSLGLVSGGTLDWRAGEPEMPLSIGTRIRAFLDGEYASDVVTVQAGDSDVELALRPSTSIFGRLEIPAGPEFARLFAARLEAGERAEELRLPPDFRRGIEARDGGFQLIGVTPGRYGFGLVVGESGIVHTWERSIEEGANVVSLRLEELPADRLITITVTDPEGLPMEGVRHFSFSADLAGSGSRRHSEPPEVAEGGRYLVRVGDVEFDALEGGRKVTVAVDHERWLRQTIELAAGVTEYAITYPPQAQLDVVLTDYLGSGLEGLVDVSVVPESEATDRFPNGGSVPWEENFRPDWLGDCRFDNLKTGPHVLIFHYSSAATASGHRYSVEWERRPIGLQPGPNRIETALPTLYTLEVEFPEVLRGEKIQVYRISAGGRSEMLEDDRVVESSVETFRVPAGEYSVHAASRRMSFRVAADRRVAYRETPFTAMQLHIREGSPLLELGLRNWDIVLAIDGKRFSDPRPSRLLWDPLEQNGRATVTVFRKEGAVDITIDRDSLRDRRDLRLTGTLDPRTRR